MEPSLKTILSGAKLSGFVVTTSKIKVNGRSAYIVKGLPGLFTKSGLMKLLGFY